MNLIVAVDKNWAIGCKNHLLVRIPADQRFFRDMTTGKVVIMGRKTLESFPGGEPLKNRTNIVITRKADFRKKGVLVAHSIEEALEMCKGYGDEDIFVIGGEEIYRQMLPYCHVAHVTKIDYVYEADAYFPNLDEDPEWEITGESDEQNYYDLEFYFYRYERKKVNHGQSEL